MIPLFERGFTERAKNVIVGNALLKKGIHLIWEVKGRLVVVDMFLCWDRALV